MRPAVHAECEARARAASASSGKSACALLTPARITTYWLDSPRQRTARRTTYVVLRSAVQLQSRADTAGSSTARSASACHSCATIGSPDRSPNAEQRLTESGRRLHRTPPAARPSAAPNEPRAGRAISRAGSRAGHTSRCEARPLLRPIHRQRVGDVHAPARASPLGDRPLAGRGGVPGASVVSLACRARRHRETARSAAGAPCRCAEAPPAHIRAAPSTSQLTPRIGFRTTSRGEYRS